MCELSDHGAGPEESEVCSHQSQGLMSAEPEGGRLLSGVSGVESQEGADDEEGEGSTVARKEGMVSLTGHDQSA